MARTRKPVVEVRRSQRRRRTVSAYRDGERVVVLIPDRFSRAEEMEWVEPDEPDWLVGAGVHVRPGTVRWASRPDVEAAGMGSLKWRALP
jgi:hypothetical protein